MTVPEVKQLIISNLFVLGYREGELLEDYPKLSNVYTLDTDGVQVNYCMKKEGDANVFEIVAFGNQDEKGKSVIRLYIQYTDVLYTMKQEDFDLKLWIIETDNKIYSSFNK